MKHFWLILLRKVSFISLKNLTDLKILNGMCMYIYILAIGRLGNEINIVQCVEGKYEVSLSLCSVLLSFSILSLPLWFALSLCLSISLALSANLKSRIVPSYHFS